MSLVHPAVRDHAWLLAAILLSLLIVGIHLLIFPPDTSDSAWDSYDYKTLSRNPFAGTTPPFGYRPLSPFIVYLLPCSIPTGYIVLTALSLVLGAITVCCLCREGGLREWESLAVIPLFLMHGGTRWLLRAPCHVDAVGTFLSGLVVLSLLAKHVGLAGPILTLSVTNKESAFFFLPFYWLARWSRQRWKTWLLECILVSLAMASVFSILRYFWYPRTLDGLSFQGVQHQYEFFAFYRSEIARLWESVGQRRLLNPATYTFGAASLCGFVFLGVRGAPRGLRAGLLVLPFIVFQLFFVTGDLRLKHQALPILLPLALRGVLSCYGDRALHRGIALIVVCGLYVCLADSIVAGVALPAAAILMRRMEVPAR